MEVKKAAERKMLGILLSLAQWFVWGSSPESGWMMAIAILALIANSYGLYLLSKHRQGEVHMRATWIFTQNDVIANFSVIIAGVLVTLFSSRFPDLVVGLGIASLVFWGESVLFEMHNATERGTLLRIHDRLGAWVRVS